MQTCDRCKRKLFLVGTTFIEHNYSLPQRDDRGNLLFMKSRVALLCSRSCYAWFRGDK